MVIGFQYAMLSMKTVSSHLIRKYKFTTPLKIEELKYSLCLMVMPDQGCLVKMQKR